jgi:hypothetical protein
LNVHFFSGKISLTTRAGWCFLCAIEMNTTFTKQITTHVPVYGWMAIDQCLSRPFGVVGVKF